MKIRKIQLTNHPVLKDLQLDFTNENGDTVDTIILAGENGTGKTSILELIYQFSQYGLDNKKRDEKRVFEIEFLPEEISKLASDDKFVKHAPDGIGSPVFIFYFDFNIIQDWNQVKVEYLDDNKNKKTLHGYALIEGQLRQLFITLFSEVEINYSPRQIQSVTAKVLDENENQKFKSGQDLATEITQLLIDVEYLDSQEFAKWGRNNIGKEVQQDKLDNRMKRFTKAFELIFPKKRFSGILNEDNSKVVKFQENGNLMSISELSSGEKQIVFRGSFLLKDKESKKGALILIDEPEISLHPSWQIEILDFYKALFYDHSANLSSQIITTTHSPFIIHNPNRNSDKVIILTKSSEGEIKVLKDPEFYSWTSKKIVKEAFNINYDIKQKVGKIFLEGPTDEKYFKTAKEIFDIQKLNHDISWIGRINNGSNEFTGDTALNHARSFFLANSDLIESKIVLFYDSDTKKPEEDFENLLIRKMPQKEENRTFRIGVENLLTLPEDFKKEEFYTEKLKIDDYGAESLIRNLDKMKLCNWICEECDIEKQKVILKNLETELLRFVE